MSNGTKQQGAAVRTRKVSEISFKIISDETTAAGGSRDESATRYVGQEKTKKRKKLSAGKEGLATSRASLE